MDLDLLKLNEDSQITQEAWYVYCKMAYNSLTCNEEPVRTFRDDGTLISNLTFTSLSADMNLEESEVKVIARKLLDLKWVGNKNGYWLLGEIKLKKPCWLASKLVQLPKLPGASKQQAPKVSSSQFLRNVAAARQRKRAVESVTKLAPGVRMQALALVRKKKNSKIPGVRILSRAQELHLEVFHLEYPMSVDNKSGGKSFPKEMGMINRYFSYCHNDENLALDMFEWVFKNWKEVTQRLGWIGAFNIGMLSATATFKVVKEMYAASQLGQNTRTSTVADRYNAADANDAPSEGF